MISYCLLVHRNPLQVSRLLDKIYSPDDLYYINVFNAGSEQVRYEWKEILKISRNKNIFMSFKYNNSWGTFGLVDATLDAMKHFANSDYKYFINLSGQDYPIKRIDSLKDKLEETAVSYMTYNKMPSYHQYVLNRNMEFPPNTKYFDRFEYLYYNVLLFSKINNLAQKIIYRGNHRKDLPYFFRIPRIDKKILYSFDFYKGSQWFCLRKSHVDYILRFVKENPDFVSFFKRTLIPDEHFFQTIIMNSSFKNEIINDNLRHITWENSRLVTFSLRDKDALQKSPQFFARKFDIETDCKILDFIDNYTTHKSD